ncbi:MAG: hypothetical protein JNJ69_16610 [Leptospiraceae bacterium]|nr:hypothetical protein [Leptospiraceae bacterium]
MMRTVAMCLAFCGSLSATAARTYYAGASVETVAPYFWFTDSVYTYDVSVEWYRAARYDFPVSPAFGVNTGFSDTISESWRLGIEFGYLYALPAESSIRTQQQVNATTVQMRETATLTHHIPRLSLRFENIISVDWNIFWRLGLAYHATRRTIDPQPQNLPAGVTLYPGNYPVRDDTFGVFTADLAFGAEYVPIAHHGISLSVMLNPTIVYPETVRNHIVMPYFATLAIGYRYLW